MKKPKLNVALLRKVARRLRRLRHESHYRQSAWLIKTDCGTAACVAGHVLLANGMTPAALFKLNAGDPLARISTKCKLPTLAKEALGLTWRQAHRLFVSTPNGSIFDTPMWPKAYAQRWYESLNSAQGERRSRIAADLLDAIADGKVKL